ncbi:MAG: hypothetical protein Q4B58_07370, partial [Bacteroidales bacterium]|nr:hypothetical protein [Bacteroidales bacterium]
AATGRNQTSTPFAPQWVGTLMYGPLAMASEDIHSWDDAEFTLQGDLREVTLQGATKEAGTNGNLYSLTLGGKTFYPDYYTTHHSTHYLRLNVETGAKKKQKGGIDITSLEQLIGLATERQAAQRDWAPHGYGRLMKQLDEARAVAAKPKKQLTQDEVNKTASALNVAINSMRPSNLAEPEDLAELLPLVTSAKEIANKSTELREAIQYADMVIAYVNDGSGTHDLIEKATARLKAMLK